MAQHACALVLGIELPVLGRRWPSLRVMRQGCGRADKNVIALSRF
ncbi:hypothetical protein O987_24055 [Comamonas testosteroni TK102]|uniref:Uncharacterized protein n=1 Tax=Comamonas testosteroni TK102 TaxID=1392005 RepID=A0A076PT43_COMTE|nr:hypothetical protein O987_24055 [Comamonas testosteroni TK102]